MTAAAASKARRLTPVARRIITATAIIVVIASMALGTKVVKIGSAAAEVPGTFAPAAYGKKEFPKLQAAIEKRAVDAATFASAMAADQAAAVKKYGVEAGTGPEISISFTGVAGTGDSGIYPVTVQGVPSSILIRVQTGPAINGTDLRDATGTIQFGQFTNQIDYQNAGAAINDEMKKEVLSKIDTAHLAGKTISVVGVFQLINPNGWLVTPVKLTVK